MSELFLDVWRVDAIEEDWHPIKTIIFLGVLPEHATDFCISELWLFIKETKQELTQNVCLSWAILGDVFWQIIQKLKKLGMI